MLVVEMYLGILNSQNIQYCSSQGFWLNSRSKNSAFNLSNNLFHTYYLFIKSELYFSHFTRFLTPALSAKCEGQSSPCLLHICTFIKAPANPALPAQLCNYIQWVRAGISAAKDTSAHNDLPPLWSYSITQMGRRVANLRCYCPACWKACIQ